MYRLILGNWKLALIWAIGICVSTAFFFARGGDEQLSESAVAGQASEASAAPAEDAEESDYEDDGGWGSSNPG